MATWIAHLRIADLIMQQKLIPKEFEREFVYGSLAPDCGYGEKDSFDDFSPPPTITHWCPDGCKIFCEYSKFYDTYLKHTDKNADYYFYLGYYVHLITDILWSTSIFIPTRIKYAKEYEANPKFINEIKKDWYALDFDFIQNTPDFQAYKLLQGVDTVKDYLPYYEHNQLAKQIKCIADYYASGFKQPHNHTYLYLTETEMSEFIKIAVDLIIPKINGLLIK